MGIVINLPDRSEWADVHLAKKSLIWYTENSQKWPELDFSTNIEKEGSIIRSFFDKVKDQMAA